MLGFAEIEYLEDDFFFLTDTHKEPPKDLKR